MPERTVPHYVEAIDSALSEGLKIRVFEPPGKGGYVAVSMETHVLGDRGYGEAFGSTGKALELAAADYHARNQGKPPHFNHVDEPTIGDPFYKISEWISNLPGNSLSTKKEGDCVTLQVLLQGDEVTTIQKPDWLQAYTEFNGGLGYPFTG